MTEDKINELVELYKECDPNASESTSNVPLRENDVLKFTGEHKCYDWEINSRKGKRMVFLCEDGIEVPAKQILRQRNGLGLTGTRVEMIKAFGKMLEAGLTLRIIDIFKQESSFFSGKNTYYIFKVVSKPEEAPEEAPAEEAQA